MERRNVAVLTPPEPNPPPWEESFETCPLCGVPINRWGPVLCSLCAQIEAERVRAYRDEVEQARRPL